mgnify:CR=1 FL=1
MHFLHLRHEFFIDEHLHSLLTHVAQPLMPQFSHYVGCHIYLVPTQSCMNYVQCILLFRPCHNHVSFEEFPRAVSEGTTVTFVIKSSGWYQIQSNVWYIVYVLEHHSATCQCHQAYIFDSDYFACTVVSHLHTFMMTDLVWWEAPSVGDWVKWYTRIDNPCRFFACPFGNVKSFSGSAPTSHNRSMWVFPSTSTSTSVWTSPDFEESYFGLIPDLCHVLWLRPLSFFINQNWLHLL